MLCLLCLLKNLNGLILTQASEEETAELSGDTSTELTPRSSAPGSDALSRSEGLPEGPAESSHDPDSFSDSYTHISSSPDEHPVSLLSAETLEVGEFIQDEERLTEEGTLPNEAEVQQEGTASDLSQRISGLGKLAGMKNNSLFSITLVLCTWQRPHHVISCFISGDKA